MREIREEKEKERGKKRDSETEFMNKHLTVINWSIDSND